jgi:hypothetical protein
VDNEFGVLRRPDGSAARCELIRFFAGEATLIDLHSGQRLRVAADGSSTWTRMTAEAACSAAGLPGPDVDGAAELERRVDPFHTDRHASEHFACVVELVRDLGLPCGYALQAYARGGDRRIHDWGQVLADAPEVFAAAIADDMADGLPFCKALVRHLAADAGLPREQLLAALADTGWGAALRDLDDHLARHERRQRARRAGLQPLPPIEPLALTA